MLNPADARLAAMLPEGVLRPLEPRHLDEPRGYHAGQGGLLAAPRSVEEVAAVVRACAAARVGIVPRGGGTGLVAGSVMPAGPLPLVLSLERMAGIRGVWPEEDVLVAESGATLSQVHDAARAVSRQFPLSLASQGTAQLGGILSTNAGGTAVLRWGNARALCLGVEAVLPDGSVLRDLRRLRKDNTGYAISDLLVGAEGTLGIITAASLRLAPVPQAVATAMLAVPDPAAALRLLALVQGDMAGCVTAFELISGQGLSFLSETLPEIRQPLPGAPWSVLLELSLPRGCDPAAMAEALLVRALDQGLASDAILAQSGAQASEFWSLREHLPVANRRIGAISSHDISLPLSEIPRFIADAGAMLAAMGNMRVNCFGHLGDGNLHYNVFPARGRDRAEYAALRPRVQEAVHEMVVARGGSFSAEHGVGRLKAADLARWGDPARLAAMRAIKAALDPLGIMNPGAVLALPEPGGGPISGG